MPKKIMYYGGMVFSDADNANVKKLEKDGDTVIKANGDLFSKLPIGSDQVVCQERHKPIIDACKNNKVDGKVSSIKCEIIKEEKPKADK